VSDVIEAYPLRWPDGWKRTPDYMRAHGRFNSKQRKYGDGGGSWLYIKELTIAEATKRTLLALERMGFNSSVVISSNLQLRNDGLPRSGQRTPDDSGVCVYWGNGKKRRCIAVDQYRRIADNLAAIAATLEAMRAIERHGGAAILDRAFTGFIALPAPEQPFQVLGISANATREDVEAAHRRLAMQHHPDRGGDASQMARINAARDAMLQP
jgi:DnaJ domain